MSCLPGRVILSFLVPMFLCGLIGVAGIPTVAAQGEPPDTLRNGFLADLEGDWTMEGHVMGDSVTYRATGTWVLAHQFLRLQMTETGDPPEYRAHVYLGYDHANETYVAHWLDDTGGGASRTIGTGERAENVLQFAFDYPEGPFQTLFVRRSSRHWRVRMRSEQEGEWHPFANFTMTPRSAP